MTIDSDPRYPRRKGEKLWADYKICKRLVRTTRAWTRHCGGFITSLWTYTWIPRWTVVSMELFGDKLELPEQHRREDDAVSHFRGFRWRVSGPFMFLLHSIYLLSLIVFNFNFTLFLESHIGHELMDGFFTKCLCWISMGWGVGAGVYIVIDGDPML